MTDALDRLPVLVLTGTTASGKNRTGARLAARVGGEVISLDSMKVYRGMTIGTAKPGPEEQAGIPHHLIDILDPLESLDLRAFVEKAQSVRRDIAGRGKIPVVVGGIIPEEDRPRLMEAGVTAVYTPKDYEIGRIMRDIAEIAASGRR